MTHQGRVTVDEQLFTICKDIAHQAILRIEAYHPKKNYLYGDLRALERLLSLMWSMARVMGKHPTTADKAPRELFNDCEAFTPIIARFTAVLAGQHVQISDSSLLGAIHLLKLMSTNTRLGEAHRCYYPTLVTICSALIELVTVIRNPQPIVPVREGFRR
jgi:hypothetical protein